MYEQLRTTLSDTLGTNPSPALRDLHFRLLRDDVPDAPARGSTASRRPTLRAGLTSFLGREAEQARVLGLLGTGRLVTVVGPGGAGKTRISTEVGRAWQTENAGAAVRSSWPRSGTTAPSCRPSSAPSTCARPTCSNGASRCAAAPTTWPCW